MNGRRKVDATVPAGASTASAAEVVLYTSPGCHYCGDAREVLARVGSEVRLQVTEVDLDSVPGQAALARWRVPFPPILILDGTLFGYGRISERKLRAALAARAV
jgi:glutaredoxin